MELKVFCLRYLRDCCLLVCHCQRRHVATGFSPHRDVYFLQYFALISFLYAFFCFEVDRKPSSGSLVNRCHSVDILPTTHYGALSRKKRAVIKMQQPCKSTIIYLCKKWQQKVHCYAVLQYAQAYLSFR